MKHIATLFVGLLIFGSNCSAQQNISGQTENRGVPVERPVKEEQSEIFTRTEQPASFPGGADSLKDYLAKHLNTFIPVENDAGGKIHGYSQVYCK